MQKWTVRARQTVDRFPERPNGTAYEQQLLLQPMNVFEDVRLGIGNHPFLQRLDPLTEQFKDLNVSVNDGIDQCIEQLV